MEPVCYFIGTTYGILFYLYFMVRRPSPLPSPSLPPVSWDKALVSLFCLV